MKSKTSDYEVDLVYGRDGKTKFVVIEDGHSLAYEGGSMWLSPEDALFVLKALRKFAPELKRLVDAE